MKVKLKLRSQDSIVRSLPVAIVILITGLLIVWANDTPIPKINKRRNVFYEKAVVTDVISNNLVRNEISGELTGTQEIKVKITSGKFKGQVAEIKNYAQYVDNITCKKGTRIIVAISISEGQQVINVYTYDRTGVLMGIFAAFCLLLLAIGGRKGIRSLLALAVTFVCVIFLFIPLIYKGVSPVIASVLIVILASFVTLILVGGWNRKSISALIATALCTSAAGILSALVGRLAHISAFTMENADPMAVVAGQSNLNLNGILFAIILIASLGATMDVCMSISSSISEIYQNNPDISRQLLFKSGINVGRDTMGTMSNTLILAFAGGYLTSIILLVSYDVTLSEIFSMPTVTAEIIQGLVGSIGIFISVPTVAFISSRLETSGVRGKNNISETAI